MAKELTPLEKIDEIAAGLNKFEGYKDVMLYINTDDLVKLRNEISDEYGDEISVIRAEPRGNVFCLVIYGITFMFQIKE